MEECYVVCNDTRDYTHKLYACQSTKDCSD